MANLFFSYTNSTNHLNPFLIRLVYTPKVYVVKGKNKWRYNKYLFTNGIPLVISTVSMTLYSRINQFTLSYFDGSYELGIYSVALTLRDRPRVFIGNALAISFLSKIYSEKDDLKARDKTSGLLSFVFIILSVFPLFFFLEKSDFITLWRAIC